MARLARIVAPGMPHHITQRGNRRMETFLREDDYGIYLELMKTWCDKYKVEIQAYCLMPNHVHLIAAHSGENDHLFRRKVLVRVLSVFIPYVPYVPYVL